MSGTGSALVVLDGSAQDIATLDWATDEAAALGTGLTVAHLHAEPVAPERAPTPLPAGRRWPEPGVLDVAAGRAAERAARVPVTTRWGGRGGAGLLAAIGGSVTRVLTRRALCPVVIAR